MSRELWADELKEALELAENFYDGTDYHFDRLTPDEQEVIIEAARRLLTGQEKWWCEKHDCQGVTSGRWCICVNVGLVGESLEARAIEAEVHGCRMVQSLVIPLVGVPEKESNDE